MGFPVAGLALAVAAGWGGWKLYERSLPVSGSELVEIKNLGSTNSPAWFLVINTNGSGVLTTAKGTATTYRAGTFDARGLKQALDSSQMAKDNSCFRSASFGAEEDLTYRGVTYTGVDCILPGSGTPPAAQINDALTTAGVGH